jgi:hypothetical protein
MTINFTDDEMVLVVSKAELAKARPEIVEGVWAACYLDERLAQQVGNFLTLGLSIMINGALRFMDE